MKRQRQLALLLLALLGLALVLAVPRSQAADPPGTDLPPLSEDPPKGPPGLEWSLTKLIPKEAGPKAAPPQRGPAVAPPQRGPAAAPEPVRVVVEAAPGQAQSAAQAILAANGRVESTYGDLVQAVVPVSALEGLTKASGVRFIRRPLRPLPLAVTSQGVSLVGASDWHRAGLTGRGVKVAIVDVGFKGYTSLLGTELPLNTVAKSFYNVTRQHPDGDINAGSVHGTACAEIVHDVAPDAQLYLVNADTEVELGNAVDWLITQGVNIISHSVVWLGSGSGDGTGPLADIVARAQQNGILWVNAAGNAAQNHWGGTWRDDDGDGSLNFSGADETNTFYASAGSTIRVLLTWDDPWGASANDYDLYLLDANLNTVDSSQSWQRGFGVPVEWIEYSVPSLGDYHLAIKRVSGQKISKLSLFVFYQTPEYTVAAGSLLPPADSDKALAAGAVLWSNWSNPSSPEWFSSRGPTLDGRIKPDLVAPDAVSTASYGTNVFYGTSAATPHVAGAAALVRQLYSGMTTTQLKDFLKSRATDLGAAGPDNLFGWGRLNLGSLASIQVTPATPTVQAGATQQFTATGLGIDLTTTVTNLTFTWSVVNADAGSINASGLFTAGTMAGPYANVVKASALGVDGYASVTVVPASIRVNPATATVQGGATQQFTATGLAIDLTTTVTNLTFTWSLADPAAGSINASGLFTAGVQAGTYTNVVKASALGVDGFASVTIPRSDIWLAPASLDVLVYDTFQLTVEVDATQTPIDEVAASINFDPVLLEVLQIQPGSGLSNTVSSQINNVQGTIDYIATGASQNGRFALATLTLRSKDVTTGVALGFSSQQPRQTYVRASGLPVLHRATGSQVAVWGLPVAAFEASPTQGLAPLTVQFTDLSLGTVTARLWNFGDGATSNQQNPTHTYTSIGNYSVSLTVSNPAVSDSRSKVDLVKVYEPPVANFQAQPVKGDAPLVVQFSDLSTGSINSWLWSFGDGTTSTLASPSHEYTSSGNYTVSLSVSGPAGSSILERPAYISVSGIGNVQGQVLLQGRSQHGKATISLGETSVAAQPDGSFGFSDLPAGYHNLTFSAPGYLAQTRRVQVMSGQTASLPPVRLAAGDVNGDTRIDMLDLLAVATQFNTTGTATDLNGDGWVDILDLTLVGQNLGLPR